MVTDGNGWLESRKTLKFVAFGDVRGGNGRNSLRLGMSGAVTDGNGWQRTVTDGPKTSNFLAFGDVRGGYGL